jgi:hypothetical protein
VITHIVLFRPKGEVGAAGMRAFATMIQTVCRETRTVKRATVGRITGKEQVIGRTSYQFAAVIEFDDEDGLRQYLNSRLHKELAALFWRLCESTIILDVDSVDVLTARIDLLLA